MHRNRLKYFIIAAVLIVIGYIVRLTDITMTPNEEEKKFAMEGSFVFITMGIYFLTALILRKAAAWIVGGVAFLFVAFFQLFRMMEYGWYISIYDSYAGRVVLGGPFAPRLLVYILIGAILGAALEIILRQYNRVELDM